MQRQMGHTHLASEKQMTILDTLTSKIPMLLAHRVSGSLTRATEPDLLPSFPY